ncbi:MAG: hypothetical protein FWD02_05060 [Bacteroidales bacterium]|nr:hypothetical protein [Bacteroidales bacterium]
MNIRFSQEVKFFIQDWAFVLFEKEYFSFYETADEYVSNIIDAIYGTVATNSFGKLHSKTISN